MVRVAEMIASGESQLAISRATGISQPTISRLVNNNETVKALIESIRERAITECAETSFQNIKGIISSTEKEDKELRLKYSAKMLESIGVLPSHTQAAITLNVFQQNNDIHLDQAADLALKHLGIDSTRVIDDED
ncbi:MAG: hypothetical protein ABSA71_09780 [Desulfomonilia bacterium]|jgi:hypothetical protein